MQGSILRRRRENRDVCIMNIRMICICLCLYKGQYFGKWRGILCNNFHPPNPNTSPNLTISQNLYRHPPIFNTHIWLREKGSLVAVQLQIAKIDLELTEMIDRYTVLTNCRAFSAPANISLLRWDCHLSLRLTIANFGANMISMIYPHISTQYLLSAENSGSPFTKYIRTALLCLCLP